MGETLKFQSGMCCYFLDQNGNDGRHQPQRLFWPLKKLEQFFFSFFKKRLKLASNTPFLTWFPLSTPEWSVKKTLENNLTITYRTSCYILSAGWEKGLSWSIGCDDVGIKRQFSPCVCTCFWYALIDSTYTFPRENMACVMLKYLFLNKRKHGRIKTKFV